MQALQKMKPTRRMSTKAVMRSLVVRVDYLLEVICPDGAKDHDDPPATHSTS